MAYVALKPCCLAGQRFKINDTIPDQVIRPESKDNLVKMGLIAEHHEEPVITEDLVDQMVDPVIPVRIPDGENDILLEVTIEGLQAVVDVLTSKAEDAKPIIERMTDGDALILMHAADSRKAIKEAAEARAAVIAEEAEADPEDKEGDE